MAIDGEHLAVNLAHELLYFGDSERMVSACTSRLIKVAYLDGFCTSIDQAKSVDIAAVESKLRSCGVTKALSIITSSLFSTIKSVPPVNKVVI